MLDLTVCLFNPKFIILRNDRPKIMHVASLHLRSSSLLTHYTPMAELSLSLASFTSQLPKMPFKILHSPSSSITPQIHNHKFLNPLSHSRPSFPFTPTIRFPSSSSPSSIVVCSPITRRFAVPHDDHEREVSNLEIEDQIDDGVQGNEQLLGTGIDELGSQGLLNQMKEIVTFTGPAIGLWICGPLMSLIDTAVIGQGSAIELAALGILVNFFYFCLFVILLKSNKLID